MSKEVKLEGNEKLVYSTIEGGSVKLSVEDIYLLTALGKPTVKKHIDSIMKNNPDIIKSITEKSGKIRYFIEKE